MRQKDFAILILSLFAIYFALQNEGILSYRKAWFYPTNSVNAVYQSSTLNPLPIVVDLNGDGHNEVIVTANDNSEIKVLDPLVESKDGQGFRKAREMGSVSLLSEGLRVVSGRQAVAIAAGYIDEKPQEYVMAIRKMVLVVVTSGWHVLCFDHNLQLMWEKSIQNKFPHHVRIKQVAINISPTDVKNGDRGLVIVGGNMMLGDVLDEDAIDRELEIEKEETEHSHSQENTEHSLDLEVDIPRHFSYYAFEGGSGEERWRHEGSDFHRDLDELQEELVPQHNYKMHADSLESRHYGEASCREYRESVLMAMPHIWQYPWNTRLSLAHFHKHMQGKGNQKGKSTANSQQKRKSVGNVDNAVSRTVSKIATSASTGGSTSQHSKPPNVVLSYQEEGIEAIHLFTGRTVCKLQLSKKGLHVDLNADGVLDHIYATSSVDDSSLHTHHHPRSCWAAAYSGIPPRQHFFNGSICRSAMGTDMVGMGAIQKHRQWDSSQDKKVEVAAPAFMPMAHTKAGAKPGVRQGYALFLNSKGELTAFDSHGVRKWQSQVGASWISQQEDMGATTRVVPTLKSIRLVKGGLANAVLAVGASTLSVVSENGNKLDSIQLPQPPSAPVEVADFTGDGYTDFIVVTKNNIFGYMQVRRPSGVPFSVLVGCLIVAMFVVYFMQQQEMGQRKKTRRVD